MFQGTYAIQCTIEQCQGKQGFGDMDITLSHKLQVKK